MRKKDREITNRQEIIDVMHRCDVCRIGLNDNGYPYILPLNFGLMDDGNTIELIFHSALEGKKLDLIQADNRASFEMDCKHQLQYFADKGYCTYSYESVMGKGHISIVADKDKEAALHLLMEHYHPNQNAYFNPAAIPRTLVYKLTVEEMTGKRKILKK
ncbi:MAG: pyridoxamine 5'-phosphate oxidase family protein [Selenomonadaceae bacterium]|nr:pyridoxamine 5'-phosphate oxidase family protein [Selenomonadaceae bacterium]